MTTKKLLASVLIMSVLITFLGCAVQTGANADSTETVSTENGEFVESTEFGTESNVADGLKSWKDYDLVGHSFGAIDEVYTYTGSLEAFQEKYEEGIRVFEVDLATASDGVSVLRHDWDIGFQEGISGDQIPTSEEFKSVPIYGKYTPLLLTDLFELMKEYDDFYVVTDSKTTDYVPVMEQFAEILREAEETDSLDVLQRFIIQIYSKNMFNAIAEAMHNAALDVQPFNKWIFTLYVAWNGDLDDFNNICQWCVMNGVDNITMWYSLYNEKVRLIAQKYGIDIYVHTENDPEAAANYLASGVTGIYTDSITDDQLEGYSDLLKTIYFSGTNYNAEDYVYRGVELSGEDDETEDDGTETEISYSCTNRSEVIFYVPLPDYEDGTVTVDISVAEIFGDAQRYEIRQGSDKIAEGELDSGGEVISFQASVTDGVLYFAIKLPDALLVSESPIGDVSENETSSLGLEKIQIWK